MVETRLLMTLPNDMMVSGLPVSGGGAA